MEEKNILGTEEIPKLLMQFAVPSILAMIISALYNIVDQIFIGNSVGILGNAATNVAFPLTTVCVAIALTCGIGAAANFNICLGEERPEESKHYIRNGLTLAATLGIILAIITRIFMKDILLAFGATDEIMKYAVEYISITSLGFVFLILVNVGSTLIRADGTPKYSMYAMAVGAVVNIFLDPIFIFVFDMGMRGAALATVLSQIISFIMVIFYIKNKFKSVDLENKFIELDFKHVSQIARLGSASGFNQVAMLVVQVVLNNFFRYYGGLSKYGSNIPLAAIGIVMKVNMIFFSINIGLSQGLQPIASFNYGARKYQRVIDVYVEAVKKAILVSLISFAIFQLFPRQILTLFGGGEELYYEFGTKLFRIFLFFVFLVGIQPVTMGFLSSIGLAKKGIVISLLRQVILLIPLSYIFAKNFGVNGLLYAAPTSDLITAIITIAIGYNVVKSLKFKM